MITTLASIPLRSHQTLTIHLLEPPGEHHAARLLHFLEHKGDDSYRGLQQRLQGLYSQHCLDRYFMGEVDGQIVGQAWYGLSRPSPDMPSWGIGNFGHVYTEPEWRGHGIASEIVRVLVDHFNADPAGQCLLCSAGAGAGRIYQKFGFQFIPPTAESGPMCLLKPEAAASFADYEQRYFTPDLPVIVREGHVGYRHDLDRMMDFSPAWIEARRRWHSAFIASAVPTYMDALHKVEDGRGLLTVLQTSAASIVGYAFVLNLGSRHEQNLMTCDFALHPNYLSQARKLLDETLYMAQQQDITTVHAFVPTCDVLKLQALQAANFTIAHTFPNAFALDGEAHDLLMLTR